ncbi:MAG: hypothetical protein ABL963_03790 [Longimicrobiales bacterium]
MTTPSVVASTPGSVTRGETLASWLLRRLLLGALWLLFFNAVLDRILVHYAGVAIFTSAYYACIAGALGIRLLLLVRRGADHPIAISALAFLAFVTVIGAAYGNVAASVFGVDQFFVGVVFLVLFAGQRIPTGHLVAALVLVQLYALIQGVWFLSAFSLPPWDLVYVRDQIETWSARNLYQGDLIRPFATFASFSEYQIVVHMFSVTLFLIRDRLAQWSRVGAWLLLISVVAMDVLIPERTPVMMGGILVSTCVLGVTLIHKARVDAARLFVGAALLALLASTFWVVPAALGDSDIPAVQRFSESFRFWEAATVRERAAIPWRQSLELIGVSPEGVGPAMVATSYDANALTPHNNFFLFAIAYSLLFPIAYFVWLGYTFRSLFGAMGAAEESRARLGFCALGLTLAYVASSIFNATLSSYMGVAFLLSMLWLHGEATSDRAMVA